MTLAHILVHFNMIFPYLLMHITSWGKNQNLKVWLMLIIHCFITIVKLKNRQSRIVYREKWLIFLYLFYILKTLLNPFIKVAFCKLWVFYVDICVICQKRYVYFSPIGMSFLFYISDLLNLVKTPIRGGIELRKQTSLF